MLSKWIFRRILYKHKFRKTDHCSLQSVVISPTNLGLVGSWRSAWSWKDMELFVILEDDAEVDHENIL